MGVWLCVCGCACCWACKSFAGNTQAGQLFDLETLVSLLLNLLLKLLSNSDVGGIRNSQGSRKGCKSMEKLSSAAAAAAPGSGLIVAAFGSTQKRQHVTISSKK